MKQLNAMNFTKRRIINGLLTGQEDSLLINKGIKAEDEICSFFKKYEKIEIMLHIAQPENGLWWF